MFRSPVAKRLFRAGLAGLVALLLVGGARPAAAIKEIWRLEVDATEIIRKNPDGTEHRVTKYQDHYTIQFEADENFVFIVPKEFLGRGRRGVFSDGSTPFVYQEAEDEPLIALWVANRVLAHREAFLAAEDYFADAAEQAGLTLRFWRDDPIVVVIGTPSQPDWVAQASFWRHRIVVKPTSDFDAHLTPVHEYFHFVQKAVWFTGDEDDFWKRYSDGSEDPFRLYLQEMTAVWTSDEPIRVLGVGGRLSENLDAKNRYLDYRGVHFLKRNKEPFFQTDEYHANLFIKYLAEQIAGKKDESAAAQVLTLFARMYERGGINRENFFQVIAEMAPPRDFGAPTWTQRWSKFFRAFSASNVVQRGASLDDPKAPVGYWDDAFTALTRSHAIDAEDTRWQEASRHSDRIYANPARDDTERRRRLERLIGEDEPVEALSYRVHPLDLSSTRRGAAPRPVFLMARGVPGTDLFLLGQRYSSSEFYYDRKSARFSWHPDFTFSDQDEAGEPRVYYEYPNFDPGTGIETLWVGLVNSGPDLQSKAVAWAYQASPRIVAREFKSYRGGTKTVELSGGSAYRRKNPDEGFYNGDSFELKIMTTGALHRKGADPNDLKPEDVAARLRVLDEEGNKILLDTGGGESADISVTPAASKYAAYWTYRFSGKFAEDNPYTGKGRFEIEITSPLNMGGDDRQVDDSYEFELRGKIPVLQRLVVAGDGPEVLYDSEEGIRRMPTPRDDAYELDIEATFSLPMVESNVEIAAGRAPPFDSYRAGQVRCRDDDRICTGRLTVPAGDVPAAGMLLRLAVGGESMQGGEMTTITGRLDADPVEPGPQPDTRHFVMLGVKEIYRLSMSSRSSSETHGQDVTVGDFGPMDFEVDLFQFRMGDDGRNNFHVESMESLVGYGRRLLDHVKKAIEAIEKQYAEASEDPEGYAARVVEALKSGRASLEELERLGPRAGLDEEGRRYLREQDARLGKLIEAFEARDQEELGRELVENRRLYLERQRSRRAFLEARYLPLIEAAHRVMNGYKEFTYREELGDPFPLSFAGLRVEWHTPGGPYPEDWASHAGGPAALHFKQGRLSAQGWSIDDLEAAFPNTFLLYPELVVWDFWPSDLAKVQTLLDLMGRYPDSFSKPPEDGVSAWIETGWDEQRANSMAEFLADYTDGQLIELVARMWGFFPISQRPDRHPPTVTQRLDEARRIWHRLPPVDGTRLIRLYSPERMPPLPLDVEGYEFELAYNPDPGPDYGMGQRPGVYGPEIDERPEYRKVTVKTIYKGGLTVRQDWQFDTTFKWVGFSPPLIVYGLPLPQPYFGSLSDPKAVPTWSILDSSSPQTPVFLDVDHPLILIQTAEEVAHGTLRGQYRRETGHYLTVTFRWDTRYRIERIGQALAPDPAEPLPAWTEPGEEPRLEPKPKPVSEETEPEAPREASASSYDPDTGITTESRRDPDGSFTVTRTDRDGKVISQQTRTPGRRLPSASSTDPQSGITTSAARTPDGATRIRRTDRDGNVLSESLVKR